MSELETKHYIANGAKEAPAAREAIEWAGQTQAQLVDLKFCDLLGTLAAHDAAADARSTSPRSTTASASTAPRSAAGRGSRSRTCC